MSRKKDDEKEEKEIVEEKKENEEEKIEEEKVFLSKEEFEGIQLQIAGLQNAYKELERDFDNFRKRSREDIEEAKREGKTKVIETFLPALDSFKKAKTMVDEKSLKGIEMIENIILSDLEKVGVKKIKCVGEKFDPNFHNAVLVVEDKKHKAGIVLEEIEGGYLLNDKVIKYSQVIISK